VKGTIRETEKTLTSANKFFDAVSSLKMRASAGIDVGTRANAVRADVDVMQNENNYFRLGLGEGPTRQPSLVDVLFNSKIGDRYGFRLGIISNQIGGGMAIFPSEHISLRGDIYDINNARPNWPKIRLGYEQEMTDFMDVTVKADDILNSGDRNIMLGVKVKPPKEKIY
jgi:hypothetical protein